jgi:UDP-N-acetylmuramyl pentapeptide synthase
MEFLKVLRAKVLWHAVHHMLAREKPRVIAVGGSIGKTSTKEAIAQAFQTAGVRFVATPGNLNTFEGVAYTILGCKDVPHGLAGYLNLLQRIVQAYAQGGQECPDYYLLEYGTDSPGDIAMLCRALPPNAVVLTGISPAHVANYDSYEAQIADELDIIRYKARGGYALANADQPGSWEHACAAGLAEGYRTDTFTHQEATKQGYRFQYVGTTVQTGLYAHHQLQPLTAAVRLLEREGLPVQPFIQSLAGYTAPAGRGRVLAGRDGMVILDESYNSSPASVQATVQATVAYAKLLGRPAKAVLGNMNELGEDEARYHHEIALFVGKSGLDAVLFVGPHAEDQVALAKMGDRSQAVATSEEAIEVLESFLESQDVVVLKASQNRMRFERLVRSLLADPADASLLVRQSARWRHT